MIGNTKITLTSESVQEALSDFLNAHFTRKVKVLKWNTTPNQYDKITVDVDFVEQIWSNGNQDFVDDQNGKMIPTGPLILDSPSQAEIVRNVENIDVN